MCGIAGYLGDFKKPQLEKSLSSLAHRGPDERKLRSGAGWGVGVQRLAVTSPGELGTQPLSSKDGRYVFTFNGQVYNYKQVRERLISLGTVFTTQSDGEVLFQSFLQWGYKAFIECEGMFACAIVDTFEKKVHLVRDPLGIKPLYYVQPSAGVFWASEVRGLLVNQLCSGVHFQRVPDFLNYRYLPSDEETLFSQVFKVPPGAVVSFCVSGQKDQQTYWNPFDFIQDREVAPEDFHKKLSESVKMTSLCDLKLGALISGGVDSSYVGSLARERISKGFFFDNGYDDHERGMANNFSHDYGLDLQIVKSQSQDIELFGEVTSSLEEPLGDLISIPTYRLLQSASREGLKVVLSGEGADELFGGYAHHWLANFLFKGRFLFEEFSFETLLPSLPKELLKILSPYPASFLKSDLKFIGRAIDKSIGGQFCLDRLFPEDFFGEADFFQSPQVSNLKDLTLKDIKYWLPNYNLLRMDKLGMAHSVEVRVPFLNRKFIEFSMSLSENHFIGECLERKKILRQGANVSGALKKKFSSRKKHPFTIKSSLAYGSSGFQNLWEEYVTKDFLDSFNLTSHQLLTATQSSGFLSEKRRVAFLSLAVWHKVFFKDVSANRRR